MTENLAKPEDNDQDKIRLDSFVRFLKHGLVAGTMGAAIFMILMRIQKPENFRELTIWQFVIFTISAFFVSLFLFMLSCGVGLLLNRLFEVVGIRTDFLIGGTMIFAFALLAFHQCQRATPVSLPFGKDVSPTLEQFQRYSEMDQGDLRDQLLGHAKAEGSFVSVTPGVGSAYMLETSKIECSKDTESCMVISAQIEGADTFLASPNLWLNSEEWPIVSWKKGRIVATYDVTCRGYVMQFDIPSARVRWLRYDKSLVEDISPGCSLTVARDPLFWELELVGGQLVELIAMRGRDDENVQERISEETVAPQLAGYKGDGEPLEAEEFQDFIGKWLDAIDSFNADEINESGSTASE